MQAIVQCTCLALIRRRRARRAQVSLGE